MLDFFHFGESFLSVLHDLGFFLLDKPIQFFDSLGSEGTSLVNGFLGAIGVPSIGTHLDIAGTLSGQPVTVAAFIFSGGIAVIIFIKLLKLFV